MGKISGRGYHKATFIKREEVECKSFVALTWNVLPRKSKKKF